MHGHNLCLLHGKVTVTEIPQSPYSQRNQPFRHCLCRFFRQTQHCGCRLIGSTKIIQFVHGLDRQSGKLSADEFRLDVENPHQPEATLFKADVFRNHFSQTACTDHDRRKLFRQTHDLL